MTNVNVVVGSITAKLKGLEVGGDLRDKLLREVATSVNAEMKTRIHENGKKSDGSPIGIYDPNYMKQRVKPPKPRTSDTNIILSRFGGMERNFTIMPTQKGYGLGFLNVLDYNKSQWNQTRFGSIYNLSSREKEIVSIVTIDVIKGAFA